MTVNLSPVGGAAAQFFDNNGVILSGGKIYTYDAGTTTPAASYTSSSGVTPHTNPIILDSAGRVPGGEIWLLSSKIYKFVFETATGTTLGTYDNIAGVNADINAFDIAYIPPFTGSVATTVGDKLAQTVSVLDFGADPTGGTDSAPAFRAAGASNRVLIVPPGTYLFDSQQPAPPSAFDDPNVLYQNLNNFTMYAYGATFVVGDNGAYSSIFHWDRCNNIAFYGGIMRGNKFGQTPSLINVALTLSSVVQFHIADVLVESGFGGGGSGISGDWLVDGVFENIRMQDMGQASDVAFLKNVTYRNVHATGADFNGNSGPGQCGVKGFSIIQDGPNISNNFTGISIPETENVSYINCSASNFGSGTVLSSGNGISYIGCDFSNNFGDGVNPGIGSLIYYVNGGPFSSVGAPVKNVSFVGCTFKENGFAGIGTGGIILDATASAGVDKISNITITGCQFDNNITQGVAVATPSVANLEYISIIGNIFSGANQTTGIASNLNAISNTLNNDNEANVSTTITFRDYVYHSNNKALYWADNSGNQQPILNVSPANVTFLRPASGAATVEVTNFAGTATQLQVDNDANNAVLIRVNGAVQRVTVGAIDSGGTGYRLLRVPN